MYIQKTSLSRPLPPLTLATCHFLVHHQQRTLRKMTPSRRRVCESALWYILDMTVMLLGRIIFGHILLWIDTCVSGQFFMPRHLHWRGYLQLLVDATYSLPSDPKDRSLIDQKALISSDSMVGESTRIEEKTSIKKSVIGRHCIIGKMAKITGCVLMDHCVISDGYALSQQPAVCRKLICCPAVRNWMVRF